MADLEGFSPIFLSSPQAFTNTFKKIKGMPPTEYKLIT